MTASKRWKLNSDDVKRVGKNALIFFAPALIVFLTTIQAGGEWQEAVDVLYLWVINTIIDLLRKLSAGK